VKLLRIGNVDRRSRVTLFAEIALDVHSVGPGWENLMEKYHGFVLVE